MAGGTGIANLSAAGGPGFAPGGPGGLFAVPVPVPGPTPLPLLPCPAPLGPAGTPIPPVPAPPPSVTTSPSPEPLPLGPVADSDSSPEDRDDCSGLDGVAGRARATGRAWRSAVPLPFGGAVDEALPDSESSGVKEIILKGEKTLGVCRRRDGRVHSIVKCTITDTRKNHVSPSDSTEIGCRSPRL